MNPYLGLKFAQLSNFVIVVSLYIVISLRLYIYTLYLHTSLLFLLCLLILFFLEEPAKVVCPSRMFTSTISRIDKGTVSSMHLLVFWK